MCVWEVGGELGTAQGKLAKILRQSAAAVGPFQSTKLLLLHLFVNVPTPASFLLISVLFKHYYICKLYNGSRYRATGYWFLYWMKDQKELNKVAFDLISKYYFTMRASSVDTLICLGKIPKLRQSIRLQLARTIGQNKMHVLIELKSMTFNLPRWKFLLCRFSRRLISAKLSNKFGGYCLLWTVSIALAFYNTTA